MTSRSHSTNNINDTRKVPYSPENSMRKVRAFERCTLTSALIILIHSVYLYLTFLRVPLNSDHANQVLQAADILSGNFFLKGWNLTGVSFYLSEIPFYILGSAIAGIDTYAYHIAAAVMIICLSFLGYMLAFKNHRTASIQKLLLYLAITGFPTLNWLGYLRGHCAIFIYFCLLLLILDRILKDENPHPALWISFGLLTACGCMSDMQLLIIGILPIILFCGINLLQNQPKFSTKRCIWLAGIAVCGTGLGMLLDSLLMKLGGINKNSFLDTRKFLDIDSLREKFLLLGKGILNVFRADLPDGQWSIHNILTVGIATLVLMLMLYFIILILLRYLKQGEGDPVSIVCTLSVTVMCIICFFTDIYTSEDSARYISYLPFAAAILICRSLEPKLTEFRPLPCLISFLAAGACLFIWPTFERIQTPQDRLAGILAKNGLTDGYADFWNASHTTVASGNTVRVRAIRGQVPELGKPDYMEMQNWFCKTEWYLSIPHNFIVFDGSGYLHVSEDVVTMLLGEPEQILESDGYRIYIYDRDLTKEIVLPENISQSQ